MRAPNATYNRNTAISRLQQVLNRRLSILHQNTFAVQLISSLREAPVRLKDPLTLQLMESPVVVSSGYIFDKKTVVGENGVVKIERCPFTRVKLSAEAYPVLLLAEELRLVRMQASRRHSQPPLS
jgi:hypothetical protein